MPRDDKVFEVRATQNLAAASPCGGATPRNPSAMFDAVLPLIERDRNPDLYATLIGNLGNSLITLGEFDRALMLHTEALEVFSARGDDSQTARELAALASIQFRSGNVERALATLESALPLYERAQDQAGLVSALRLAGNAAAELGQHDTALDYLRRAERQDKNGITIDRTRVLIAGELRTLGDLRGADELLAQVLLTKNEPSRADALAERARLREQQQRSAEALADLREADAHLRAPQARLQSHRHELGAGAGPARCRRPGGRRRRRRHRGRHRDTHPRELGESRVARALPVGELRALRGAHRSGPGAGAARGCSGRWKAFRVAEAIRARSLADRLAHAARRGDAPRDENADRLRERMTALQVDLERRMRKASSDDADVHETRRLIDEVQARLEARVLRQHGVQPTTVSASPNRARTCRRHCPPTRRYWRTSSAISVRMPGC